MTTSDTTAVVLAAGEGQRLSPLTNRRPKPMVPVGNQPLIAHVLEAIAAAGVERVVVVVGYERTRIQTYVGDGDDWGLDVTYAVQEPQLGTAHALLQAREQISGPVVVTDGDRIVDPDAITGATRRLTRETEAVVTVARGPDPGEYGVVTLDGDRVSGIVEKPPGEPPSEWINAGVYAFRSSIFDVLEALDPAPGGEYRLPDAVSAILDDRVVAYRYDGRWLDVSYLWDLLAVTDAVGAGAAEAGGTQRAGAQVSTAAHVGPGATVGVSAVVGGGSAVGANAHVGANATLDRTVVLPDATVGPGAVLKDCIVGANATVGPNATVPGGEATVIVDDELHRGVPFGGAVGDNAHLGGGAILEAGAVVGDSATVAPGATVDGRVAPGVEVVR